MQNQDQHKAVVSQEWQKKKLIKVPSDDGTQTFFWFVLEINNK
jgi:hypothetical protein